MVYCSCAHNDRFYKMKLTKDLEIYCVFHGTFELKIGDAIQIYESDELELGMIYGIYKKDNDTLYFEVRLFSTEPIGFQCYQVKLTKKREQWLFNSIVPAFVGEMEGKNYYSVYKIQIFQENNTKKNGQTSTLFSI